MNIHHYNANTTDNQKELLVEVDENDNVIGSVLREICHNQTRKPWHRTTHIYLFDTSGNLYLTQRSMKKDTAAGLWTVSAGGHVSWGSTPEETATREVYEELTLEVVLESLGKVAVDFGTEREVISIFTGVAEKTPKINEEEVQQIKSFQLEEITAQFIAKEFRLSGGSNHTFRHLINTGALSDFRDRFIAR